VGNALQILPSRLHLTAERWCRTYGPVFRFDIGPRTVVGIGDGATINAILRDRPDRFRRWRELAVLLEEMEIDGVFNAEGDDWRRQRRLAVTALNVAHLHRYFEVIHLATQRLHRALREAAAGGAPLAIEHAFASYTVDVTSALAFGQDLASRDRDLPDLREHIDRVFAAIGRRVTAPVPYWRTVRLPADRAVERSLTMLELAVAGFIADARERMLRRPELYEQPENFLEAMLSAQAQNGSYDDRELFGNALTMLLAGEDTTSRTLAWTVWLLACHPDVQDRLAAEADDLLGARSVADDHETAAAFGYGEAVLRESVRLRPAASVLFIEAIDDTVIADVAIPADTRLMLLTRHVAVQEASFAHPRRFDPSRWMTDEHGDGAHDPKAFLAFGAGPRFCPGRNLAFLEAKAALAMLAHNFHIELDPSAPPVREQFSFTTGPRGLRVHLRERRTRPREGTPPDAAAV
jgi:cytochrome P450